MRLISSSQEFTVTLLAYSRKIRAVRVSQELTGYPATAEQRRLHPPLPTRPLLVPTRPGQYPTYPALTCHASHPLLPLLPPSAKSRPRPSEQSCSVNEAVRLLPSAVSCRTNACRMRGTGISFDTLHAGSLPGRIPDTLVWRNTNCGESCRNPGYGGCCRHSWCTISHLPACW